MNQLQLDRLHRSLGAEMVEFAGWGMPLKYGAIAEEHMAVRKTAGLFDVSHMGEFRVAGPKALEFLQLVTSNDVSRLVVGAAQYSTVLNENGGTKDDIVVYRLGEQEFMVVCNASNVAKIWGWFSGRSGSGVELEDTTMSTLLISIQGPRAESILQSLTKFDLSQIKRFKSAWVDVVGLKALASRSGYTGENGFEIFLTGETKSNPSRAEKLWTEIMDAGKESGLKPCGLGARDTTRLEAGLCLYGNDLTEEITPLEARLDFVVKLEKEKFIGKEALLLQKSSGLKKARIGLHMLEPGIPRQGYRILADGKEIGYVTSGTFSPLLNAGIAMGYASPGLKVGDGVFVEIHDKPRRAEVVEPPFYDAEKYGYKRR
ncbi:MAG: glycine cleavage system aminomethyltransferase GcvT [Candidatus Hadarchaeota archaeon]